MCCNVVGLVTLLAFLEVSFLSYLPRSVKQFQYKALWCRVKARTATNMTKAGATLPSINSNPLTLVLLFAFRHLIQYLGTGGEN